MAESIGAIVTYVGSSSAGEAAVAGVASAAAGYGLNKAFSPKGGINIPPPPGAAIVDPAGRASAAAAKQRQAAAGGIQSTITGAGSGAAPASGGPTSGTKQLSGQ